MADFYPAFDTMMRNEGGYVLHTVPGDRGGMTYAGIARNMQPQWPGWALIDGKQDVPTQMVRDFYRRDFWDTIRGNELQHQAIAEAVFDFHVNAGRPARTLAQIVVGATPDGHFGPATLKALNDADPEVFVLRYALAKIARYRDIVTRNRPQIKFLLGWVNRTLKGIEA